MSYEDLELDLAIIPEKHADSKVLDVYCPFLTVPRFPRSGLSML